MYSAHRVNRQKIRSESSIVTVASLSSRKMLLTLDSHIEKFRDVLNTVR